MRGYLQKQKWFKDHCIIKAHPRMGNSSQELGICNTLHSLEAAHTLKVSFPSDSVDRNLFQATQLVTASPRPLIWFQSLLGSLESLRVTLGSFYSLLSWGEGSSQSGQFQGVPKAILFTHWFKKLPWRVEYFSLEENCYPTCSHHKSHA